MSYDPDAAIGEVAYLEKDTAIESIAAAEPVKRKASRFSVSSSEKRQELLEAQLIHDEKKMDASASAGFFGFFENLKYETFHPYVLGGLAALILGWWISSTILPSTQGRW